MSLNVVDNTNYGFTEGATKAETLNLPWTSRVNGIYNANERTAAGVYVSHISGGNSNLPNASSNGILLVMIGGDTSSSDITQVFFDNSDHKIYTRWRDNGSWTSWVAFGA